MSRSSRSTWASSRGWSISTCRGDRRRRCVDLVAEAQNASLGGGDAGLEEPVRHPAGHLLWLPKNELHWRGIHNSIVDIALSRTPDLAIVDGIIGMEGDGPLNASPSRLAPSSWATISSPSMRPAVGS